MPKRDYDLILGESDGSQLDRITEILGDEAYHHHHHRRRHHHRGQQPPYNPQAPGQTAAYVPPAPVAPVVAPTPAPTSDPNAPQPTIDVFVGACLRDGVSTSSIVGCLKRRGYTGKQISNAFSKNM